MTPPVYLRTHYSGLKKEHTAYCRASADVVFCVFGCVSVCRGGLLFSRLPWRKYQEKHWEPRRTTVKVEPLAFFMLLAATLLISAAKKL